MSTFMDGRHATIRARSHSRFEQMKSMPYEGSSQAVLRFVLTWIKMTKRQTLISVTLERRRECVSRQNIA